MAVRRCRKCSHPESDHIHPSDLLDFSRFEFPKEAQDILADVVSCAGLASHDGPLYITRSGRTELWSTLANSIPASWFSTTYFRPTMALIALLNNCHVTPDRNAIAGYFGNHAPDFLEKIQAYAKKEGFPPNQFLTWQTQWIVATRLKYNKIMKDFMKNHRIYPSGASLTSKFGPGILQEGDNHATRLAEKLIQTVAICTCDGFEPFPPLVEGI